MMTDPELFEPTADVGPQDDDEAASADLSSMDRRVLRWWRTHTAPTVSDDTILHGDAANFAVWLDDNADMFADDARHGRAAAQGTAGGWAAYSCSCGTTTMPVPRVWAEDYATSDMARREQLVADLPPVPSPTIGGWAASIDTALAIFGIETEDDES